MKGKFLYLTLGLLPLLSSCIFDDDVVVVERQESVMVTFSLDVSSQSMTKADDYTWGDDYPKVTSNDFEDKIITSSLKVLAYDTSGAFVGELPILQCTETGGKVEFLFAFDATVDVTDLPTYKFVVIANCVDTDYGLSYADGKPVLDNLVFSMPLQEAIPMWGVKTFKFTDTDGDGVLDETQDLGAVSMLRAVAKIGVDLSDGLKEEGYSIASLKLNYAGANGYSVPKGWNEVENTEALAHVGGFRNNVLSQNLNFWGYGEDTGTQYMYVPETKNDETELAIAVTLANSQTAETFEFPYEKGIKFCEYASGEPSTAKFDIVRNHYYDYTITKINTGKELELTLNVKDWDVVTENIEFTNEVTVSEQMEWSGTYLKPSDTDESVLYIDGSYTVADAVSTTFKIDTPVGATWYASFEGDKDAFSFLVETTADDTERLEETTERTENDVTTTVYWKKATSVSGVVGEASVLRVITNSKEVSENKSVSLKIVVVTMDGRTIMVNELLMPESLEGKEYYQLRQNLS